MSVLEKQPMKKQTPQVALIIETSKEYGRSLLRGIDRFMNENSRWLTFIEERDFDGHEPHWLEHWQGNGIITRSSSKIFAERARARGIAVVDLRYWEEYTGKDPFPNVDCDQEAIAKIAADHLIERQFIRFAYCGVTNKPWSQARQIAFSNYLKQKGFPCEVFKASPQLIPWEFEQVQLSKWLREFQTPVGILAANDVRGCQITEICQQNGIQVPEHISVIGVDDDPVFCNFSNPPLSSIDQDVERIGYRAAQILEQMMGKGTTEHQPSPIIISPKGVVSRQSTDIIHVKNSHVAKALDFIRHNGLSNIDVSDVVATTGLSRRGLEKLFSKILGRSILSEIHRTRIARIKELLLKTDAPLEAIAEKTGFTYTATMATLFKKMVGVSPGRFRKENLEIS